MDSINTNQESTSSAGIISSVAAQLLIGQEQTNFALSIILEAHHPNDAKCISELPNAGLVSGGRDGLLKLWSKK